MADQCLNYKVLLSLKEEMGQWMDMYMGGCLDDIEMNGQDGYVSEMLSDWNDILVHRWIAKCLTTWLSGPMGVWVDKQMWETWVNSWWGDEHMAV